MVGAQRHLASFFMAMPLTVLAGCGVDSAVEAPAKTVPAVLDAAANRLGHSLSLTKLNHLATHQDALLDRLTPSERASLGSNYLKLTLHEPMVVSVAVPAEWAPFWLADQGFEPTSLTLRNADAAWSVYSKSVPAGSLGLGVNGLDRTPPAHYAVFLKPRSPVEHAKQASEPVNVSSSLTAPVELRDPGNDSAWHLVKATSRVSPSHDVFRPFDSLPSELADSLLLQSSHESRHAALLAPGRIWKTHDASGPKPDQVTIAFGADPSRELVWSWRTSPDVTGTAIRLALATAEKPNHRNEPITNPAEIQRVEGESTLYETPCVLNDRAIRRHRVAVHGLKADRSYLYSLGDGTPEGWGPWTELRTPDVEASRIKFLYLGDPQTGFETWGPRLASAYQRNPDVRFALIAGDLVDRGNERTNWDHFFLRSDGVFSRLPLMPSVGNHEYLDQGPRLFRMFFDLPRNGPATSESDLVYSFEYGDAFFAILDSTMAVSSRTSAIEQAQWLDRELERSKATWKFVMFHHPVYASRPRRDNRSLQELWVPIFDKHHVDVVLQGHDHSYIRTHALRDGQRVATASEGTYYVVSVSGDKYYDQESRSTYATTRSHLSTYQVLDLDFERNVLKYQSMSESGEVVDEFSIDKAFSQGSARQFANRK